METLISSSVEPLEKALLSIQKKHLELIAWEISGVKHHSEQRLLDGVENNRLDLRTARYLVIEKTVSFTVYSSQNHLMGSASVTLQTDKPFEEQILLALNAAKAGANPPWELAGPSKPKARPREIDPAIDANVEAVCDQIVERANTICQNLDGVHVNYVEVFVTKTSWLFKTSTGFVDERKKSDIYFEAAMEKLPLPNTQEVHNNSRSLDLAGLDLENFLSDSAEEVRALDKVELPQTDNSVVVLLHADALSSLFHTLIDQLDAGRQYGGRPYFPDQSAIYLGEKNKAADKISIKLDPHLDLMPRSTPYAPGSVPSAPAQIIKDDLVTERYASHQMAQYLKIPSKGICGNLVVDTGKYDFASLLALAPKVLEIKSFSSLLTNSDSQTYSSEIKLGILHETVDGKPKQTFVKGGVISGNIRENLSDIYLSKTTKKISKTADSYHAPQGYLGPKWALIKKGVSLSGK
jgi:predicted Zn-dependent protease